LAARSSPPRTDPQTMTGTVDEWQAWTGMVFPATGDVMPGGLSTVHIDEENDRGTCTEPMTS
jgi:hypothetical protein